jgi:dienelactone hydrolase
MHEEKVLYQAGDTTCKGYLAFDAQLKSPRPVVIVAHAWRGQDDFARHKAVELAKLGYIGFAADIYGNGQEVQTKEDSLRLMLPFAADRVLLQERIKAAYETAKNLPNADPQKIGAIGFCFGGMTVIELLRSGVDLKGIVSFHGVLGNKMDGKVAKMAPKPPKMNGSILILHGHEDPMVSQQDLLDLEQELTEANVDWQVTIYGQTMHAFTNPIAQDPSSGLLFNPKSAQRAWLAMINFFNQVF